MTEPTPEPAPKRPIPKRPKRSRAPGPPLTRDRILDAALDLVDRNGLAALSMRRLGTELGVEGMALYHYVPSKDALLDGMVERVVGMAQTTPAAGQPWREMLRDFAFSYRSALLRHPGVLPLVATRPVMTVDAFRAVERAAALLTASGFSLDQALAVINGLTMFVIGHSLAAVGRTPGSEEPEPDVGALVATLDPAEFPLVTCAMRTGAGLDLDAGFGFTLDAMLTGFDASRDERR
jgi:TetR/AcrR family transcriptional regulator, tetracycline repressor protein